MMISCNFHCKIISFHFFVPSLRVIVMVEQTACFFQLIILLLRLDLLSQFYCCLVTVEFDSLNIQKKNYS